MTDPIDLPGIRARDANDDPGYETLATAADIRKQDRRALLQLVDAWTVTLREISRLDGANDCGVEARAALALVDGDA